MHRGESSVPEESPEPGWDTLAVGVVALSAIVLILILVGYTSAGNHHKELGPLGDWFGGILNPIVAFLALMGLVRTVAIQRDTLELSRGALRQQIALQQKQQSKQTFFDLLRLRSEAVASVEWRVGDQVVLGRAAMKAILGTIDSVASELSSEELQEDLEHWKVPANCPPTARPYVALFAAFYSRDPSSWAAAWHQTILEGEGQLASVESELGHVFRATYQVLKYVYRNADFSIDEKLDLVNYLRAQMSENEFALFALTASTFIGAKSRAVSIAFDLYQDRLYSIWWARDLRTLFDPFESDNRSFASSLGYPPLVGSEPC